MKYLCNLSFGKGYIGSLELCQDIIKELYIDNKDLECTYYEGFSIANKSKKITAEIYEKMPEEIQLLSKEQCENYVNDVITNEALVFIKPPHSNDVVVCTIINSDLDFTFPVSGNRGVD